MPVLEAKSVALSSSIALQQNLFDLLQSCRTTRELFQIHSQIITNGFSQRNFILVKLLSFCFSSGEDLHACRAFKEIENPSTIVWNQMIKGFSKSENPQRSIQLYNVMDGTDAKASGFTYSFLLSACARSPLLLREGEQLHGRVLSSGFCSSNVFVQTNLVNMYAMAGGNVGGLKARRVFEEMTHRNVVTWNSMLALCLRSGEVDEARRAFDDMPERNVVSWTTMIAGCAQNGRSKSGRSKQALALFNEMRRARVEVDQVTMVAALSACAELGDLKMGKWIHSYIGDSPTHITDRSRLVTLNNSLINMYASCGVIEEAYRVFKEMPRRTVVSWTTMITGFAKQGRGEEALGVFKWMQSEGVKPDELTFLGVLCACSHRGMVEEGRHYFGYMKESCGLEPRIEHYGCMVDLLSRAGLLDEAQKLMETLPMKPNEVLWGALLGGCKIHKNAELATHVANQLVVELKPERAAGYLVLLSNVYAAARRWDNVAEVRQLMVDMGAKKPPGRSWIQVNGVIHDFVAGDWTHKHALDIYGMLGELTMQAKLENHKLENL